VDLIDAHAWISTEKLYAPVVSLTSVRTALLLRNGASLSTKVDIVNAFIYTEIKEELYISLLEGYKEYDTDGNELYGRMLRALYGTKQATFEWRQKFDGFLRDNGFQVSASNPRVYILWS
jgi:hypothetical protein